MAISGALLEVPSAHLSSYWVIHPLGSGRESGFVLLIAVLLVSFVSRGCDAGVVEVQG